MLLLLAMTPFFVVIGAMLRSRHNQLMPAQVVVAGGVDRGVYNEISSTIAARLKAATDVPASMVETGGSEDNRERLLSRQVDLAPMQASSINSDQLCVVAPLFDEAAHLLVHPTETTGTPEILDFEFVLGKPIAVGPEQSGSRQTADMILESLELSPQDCPRQVISWNELGSPDAPSVALICVGRGSSLVADLLQTGWQLIPIPQTGKILREHPTLKRAEIEPTHYAGADIPPQGVETVGMTAFLAARRDAPSALVEATLDVLYQPPEIISEMITRKSAAEWQQLDLHHTARHYYASLRAEED